MKKINVCIIGCGMIANSAHIPAYKANEKDYEIVAVCDNFTDNAKKTAENNGIDRWYTNPEEMLKAEKPDVVSVCAPNMFHKECVMLALSYGANVLCEKPLGLFLVRLRKCSILLKSKANSLWPVRVCVFYLSALKLRNWLIAVR